MAISTEDLRVLAAQVRQAADDAGELQPSRIGPLKVDLPEAVRQAISEDLKSGAYRQAADDATKGDPDVQSL